MIGQSYLLNNIQTLVSNNKFPGFSIILGPKGSGKHELVSYIHSLFPDYICYKLPDIKIDTIREMIDDVSNTKDNMLVVIYDADTMSVNAKNALLKIVEEPPKNAYIIMTLQDANNTLETIRSRAFLFIMENYSNKEIAQFISERNIELDNDELSICKNVCEVPGDVESLTKYSIKEFYDFVELVIDNIAECEPANSFKSSGKLNIKNDEGYDLKLFWKIFIHICMIRCFNAYEDRYVDAISVTSKYVQKLYKLGINKQQMYDMWVFDIRNVL